MSATPDQPASKFSTRCLRLMGIFLFLTAVLLAVLGGIFIARSNKSSSSEAGLGLSPNRVTLAECAASGVCAIDISTLDLEGTSISFQLTETGTAVDCDRLTVRGKSWHGVCSGGGTANVIKTDRKNSKGEDLIHGSVSDWDNDLICQLSPDAEERNTVVCTPASEFPEGADPVEDGEEMPLADSQSINPLRGGSRALQKNACGYLDILVVWTLNAECRQSGLGPGCTPTAITERNMRGHIDLAIEESNTAFEKSGISAELRLVHAYREWNYVERTDPSNPGSEFNKALWDITRPNDGIMDDIHAKREQFGADIVAMLIDGTKYCGMGHLGPGREKMFSVTKYSCAVGSYSFVHEVGHNMGCDHDSSNAAQCLKTDGFAYGYRDPESRFRSIMAYDCKRAHCDGKVHSRNCPRVQSFSNPRLSYNGLPIGTASSDNARQINEVVSTVAGYFPCKDQCKADTDCAASDKCEAAWCDAGICKSSPINCDDNNACTTDTCENGRCLNTPISCDDNNACTTDTCVNGRCFHSPISCDDGNICTIDQCDKLQGCLYSLAVSCCGNGICEEGFEDVDSCPADCLQAQTQQPSPEPARVTSAPTSLAPLTTESPSGVTRANYYGYYYISYAIDQASREPTEEEYKELWDKIRLQVSVTRRQNYPTLDSVSLPTITTTPYSRLLFQAGYPDPRFNIYTDFYGIAGYRLPNDSPTRDDSEMWELFQEVIYDEAFLAETVRSLVGTPFETTAEVVVGRVDCNDPFMANYTYCITDFFPDVPNKQ